MVDSRILCRMRAVHAAYETTGIKYQSAGRLPIGSQVRVEYHFRLAASYTPSPLRGPLPLKETQVDCVLNFILKCYGQYSDESATSGGFSPFGAYGTTFPPQKRGHNKAPYSIPLISGSKVSTGCCPTACGGKVVAPATKGGAAFPSPAKAVVKVL